MWTYILFLSTFLVGCHVTRAEEDFKCPEPDGQFPDPSNCTTYYNCWKNAWTKQNCPAGLHFDPKNRYCNWPKAVTCHGAPVSDQNRTSELPGAVKAKPAELRSRQSSRNDHSRSGQYNIAPASVGDGYQGQPSITSVPQSTPSTYPSPTTAASVPVSNYGSNSPNTPAINYGSNIPSVNTGRTFIGSPASGANAQFPSPCKAPTGQYADPKSCSHYYNCWNGDWTHMQCPDNLYWDDRVKYCNWPSAVDCKIPTVAPTTTTTRLPSSGGQGYPVNPSPSQNGYGGSPNLPSNPPPPTSNYGNPNSPMASTAAPSPPYGGIPSGTQPPYQPPAAAPTPVMYPHPVQTNAAYPTAPVTLSSTPAIQSYNIVSTTAAPTSPPATQVPYVTHPVSSPPTTVQVYAAPPQQPVTPNYAPPATTIAPIPSTPLTNAPSAPLNPPYGQPGPATLYPVNTPSPTQNPVGYPVQGGIPVSYNPPTSPSPNTNPVYGQPGQPVPAIVTPANTPSPTQAPFGYPAPGGLPINYNPPTTQPSGQFGYDLTAAPSTSQQTYATLKFDAFAPFNTFATIPTLFPWSGQAVTTPYDVEIATTDEALPGYDGNPLGQPLSAKQIIGPGPYTNIFNSLTYPPTAAPATQRTPIAAGPHTNIFNNLTYPPTRRDETTTTPVPPAQGGPTMIQDPASGTIVYVTNHIQTTIMVAKNTSDQDVANGTVGYLKSEDLKQPKVKCPQPTGVFPDAEECDAYIVCYNGGWTRLHCPSGSYFDENKKLCSSSWDSGVGCRMIKPDPKPQISVSTSELEKEETIRPRSPTKIHFSPVITENQVMPIVPGYSVAANVIPGSHNLEFRRAKRSLTNELDDKEFECPELNGLFRHESDCTRFWSCGDGIAYLQRCPEPLFFDVNAQRCEWFRGAQCNNGMIEVVTKPSAAPPTTEKSVNTTQSSPRVTTISSGSSRADAKFRCPSARGAFPHRKDCSKFYNCTNWKAEVSECPGWKLFNVGSGSCEEPRVARCLHGALRPAERRFNCPTEYGYFPDPNDCRKFYQCNGWTAYHLTCPGDLWYNPKFKVCDYPENVKKESPTCRVHEEKPVFVPPTKRHPRRRTTSPTTIPTTPTIPTTTMTTAGAHSEFSETTHHFVSSTPQSSTPHELTTSPELTSTQSAAQSSPVSPSTAATESTTGEQGSSTSAPLTTDSRAHLTSTAAEETTDNHEDPTTHPSTSDHPATLSTSGLVTEASLAESSESTHTADADTTPPSVSSTSDPVHNENNDTMTTTHAHDLSSEPTTTGTSTTVSGESSTSPYHHGHESPGTTVASSEAEPSSTISADAISDHSTNEPPRNSDIPEGSHSTVTPEHNASTTSTSSSTPVHVHVTEAISPSAVTKSQEVVTESTDLPRSTETVAVDSTETTPTTAETNSTTEPSGTSSPPLDTTTTIELEVSDASEHESSTSSIDVLRTTEPGKNGSHEPVTHQPSTESASPSSHPVDESNHESTSAVTDSTTTVQATHVSGHVSTSASPESHSADTTSSFSTSAGSNGSESDSRSTTASSTESPSEAYTPSESPAYTSTLATTVQESSSPTTVHLASVTPLIVVNETHDHVSSTAQPEAEQTTVTQDAMKTSSETPTGIETTHALTHQETTELTTVSTHPSSVSPDHTGELPDSTTSDLPDTTHRGEEVTATVPHEETTSGSTLIDSTTTSTSSMGTLGTTLNEGTSVSSTVGTSQESSTVASTAVPTESHEEPELAIHVDFKCPEHNGKYNHPLQDHVYFVCSNGVPQLTYCPIRHIFIANLRRCLPKSLVEPEPHKSTTTEVPLEREETTVHPPGDHEATRKNIGGSARSDGAFGTTVSTAKDAEGVEGSGAADQFPAEHRRNKRNVEVIPSWKFINEMD